mmetsp:Transcript_145654/g.378812  ORF Transcript_145654/g.378812 Transcript_145654/m.378812 type:complete len:218 (+) Transcript_145654:284-937(+)
MRSTSSASIVRAKAVKPTKSVCKTLTTSKLWTTKAGPRLGAMCPAPKRWLRTSATTVGGRRSSATVRSLCRTSEQMRSEARLRRASPSRVKATSATAAVQTTWLAAAASQPSLAEHSKSISNGGGKAAEQGSPAQVEKARNTNGASGRRASGTGAAPIAIEAITLRGTIWINTHCILMRRSALAAVAQHATHKTEVASGKVAMSAPGRAMVATRKAP